MPSASWAILRFSRISFISAALFGSSSIGMPRIHRARARILGGATRIGDPTTHRSIKGAMFSAYLPKNHDFSMRSKSW
jgi:hypothetical protein